MQPIRKRKAASSSNLFQYLLQDKQREVQQNSNCCQMMPMVRKQRQMDQYPRLQKCNRQISLYLSRHLATH